MSSTWRTTGIPHLISGDKSSFDLKEKDENSDNFGLVKTVVVTQSPPFTQFF